MYDIGPIHGKKGHPNVGRITDPCTVKASIAIVIRDRWVVTVLVCSLRKGIVSLKNTLTSNSSRS